MMDRCYILNQHQSIIKNLSNIMDINDFKGLTGYKFIIPTIYICSWFMMIVGPVYFDVVYQYICLFFLFYSAVKVFIVTVIMIIVMCHFVGVYRRLKISTDSLEPKLQERLNLTEEIYYGFIIPNYKEDVEMMAETLEMLANHTRAKQSYCIFLAMEKHEEGSEQKAYQLIELFKDKFRAIDFTQHEVREFEQKGKASNVSWCAEHLQPILHKHKIIEQNLFLTIMDADSWAPNVYFDIMEQHILSHYEQRHLYIYQPPQIFTRNNMDVPIFTRVYDMMHGYAHCSNLFSCFNLTFPLSNYSLSYALVKRIGFWDTCADAIGEDFHTTQKAFWKTGGEIKTFPIYAAFNQVNIATGKGYVQDVLARFWQAERHAQGVADVAYNFKMLFKQKFRPMNLVLWYQIFQTFALPAILPWILLSLLLQSKILFYDYYPPYLVSQSTSGIFFNIMGVGGTVSYILYDVFKRLTNYYIYKRKNQSLLRMIEYPVLFMVNFFLISVPTFTIAAFMTLFGKREYIVAEKKNTTEGRIKDMQRAKTTAEE